MPTIDDIKAALAAGDAEAAEALIEVVGAKNDGRGIGGEDRSIFMAQLAALTGAVPATPGGLGESEDEPEDEPEDSF